MAAEYNDASPSLGARLVAGRPLLLDGATGTELERRGVPSSLPLWSAHGLLHAPEVVRAIHRDYLAAGAELLTANTFRTQRRALARGGLGDRAGELTRRAVELAREAAQLRAGAPAWVLGSAPPLEDCYRPDRVPDEASLAREHAEHARHLVAAGVDAILVETMNTRREALAAARAARDAGSEFLACFVCWEGDRLLSGEPLGEALAALDPLAPLAVGVNCLPASAVPACLPTLRAAARPFGVYANLGEPNESTGFTRSEELDPEGFAGQAAIWLDAGASFVGGCCGTGPAHIRALRERIDRTGS